MITPSHTGAERNELPARGPPAPLPRQRTWSRPPVARTL